MQQQLLVDDPSEVGDGRVVSPDTLQVGDRVKILWEADMTWYEGVIICVPEVQNREISMLGTSTPRNQCWYIC